MTHILKIRKASKSRKWARVWLIDVVVTWYLTKFLTKATWRVRCLYQLTGRWYISHGWQQQQAWWLITMQPMFMTQREMSEDTQMPYLFLFIKPKTQSMRWCCPYSGWVFAPQTLKMPRAPTHSGWQWWLSTTIPHLSTWHRNNPLLPTRIQRLIIKVITYSEDNKEFTQFYLSSVNYIFKVEINILIPQTDKDKGFH